MSARDPLGINTGPEFALDVVLDAARAEAGLDDFGDDGFVEALAKMLETVGAEVRFKPAGLLNFKLMNQRLLVNRLRYQQDVTRHPEILAEDVSDPIIILGMPRTGTTKLQRMMSADTNAISLLLWMAQNPARFPGELPGQPDQRIAFARAIQDAQAKQNPDFLASHERTAEDADEDSDLLLGAFDYVMLYIIDPAPSFLAWVQERSRLPAYRYQMRMLQYLQWQQGGKQNRHWVLKNPGHIGSLDAIVEVYPRATLLELHRDLVEVIPSYCRLIESIHTELFEGVDAHEVGRDTLRYWGPEMRRHARQRSRLADRLSILDFPYMEVVKDPMTVIRAAYERADIRLTDAGRQSMLEWADENAQHRHGTPAYSLERYGLTVEMIDEAFAASNP